MASVSVVGILDRKSRFGFDSEPPHMPDLESAELCLTYLQERSPDAKPIVRYYVTDHLMDPTNLINLVSVQEFYAN